MSADRPPRRLRFDHAPGAAVSEQRLQHRIVELVTAPHRTIAAEQRKAGQREIADHVEHLVAGALVGVAQPLDVEQAGLVEHHGVVEGCAEREASAPQPCHVIHAAEGPGPRNVAAETFWRKIEGVGLVTDHLVGEVDLDFGAEPAGERTKLAHRIADLDLHRLQHLDEAADGGLGHNAGLVDGRNKRRSAAVHDRNFRPIDFDRGVVNAHAAQRGQNVLRGRDQRPFAVTQHRREFGRDHSIGSGGDFAVCTIETGADKNKTRIDRCRSQRETNRKTGMNAYASHGGLRPKRCLTAELHSIMPTTRLRSIQVAKLPQGRLA